MSSLPNSTSNSGSSDPSADMASSTTNADSNPSGPIRTLVSDSTTSGSTQHRPTRVRGSRCRSAGSRPPSFLVGNYHGFTTSQSHSSGSAVPVKGESFCDCPLVYKLGAPGARRYLECTCGEEETVFEWLWDPDVRSSATEISEDGRSVRFHMNYSCGTAAARGNKPLSNGQYFWEIKMTTPVYGTDMMIGVGTGEVDLDAYRNTFCSFLGQTSESWGLSYMSRVQHKGQMTAYGSRFGQGSIIGIHLDMWHGTVFFYKNRRPLGLAFEGLQGKTLYPMVSSTAAQSGMKIIKACSFQSSLQFMCCQVLRRLIPAHLDVMDAVWFPPGLKDFLDNNLSWLLRPSELAQEYLESEHEGSDTGGDEQGSKDRPVPGCSQEPDSGTSVIVVHRESAIHELAPGPVSTSSSDSEDSDEGLCLEPARKRPRLQRS